MVRTLRLIATQGIALAMLAGCVGGGSNGGSGGSGGSGDPADGGDEPADATPLVDVEVVCEFPPSQGASEPCCLSLGIDGCGAGLFCAAFDGRRQPTCYADGSRQGAEECGADAHCRSAACDEAAGRCLGSHGGSCTAAIGCAQSDPDRYMACEAESDTCQFSSGRRASGCGEDRHCVDFDLCLQNHCGCLPITDELRLCTGEQFGELCESDADCEDHGEGAWRCLVDLYHQGPLLRRCHLSCADDDDCAVGNCRVSEDYCQGIPADL